MLYSCDSQTPEEWKERALLAYRFGLDEARSLSPVHSLRLGLSLNFAVYVHDILEDTMQAYEIANHVRNSNMLVGMCKVVCVSGSNVVSIFT